MSEVQKIYPAMAGILADMDAITKDKKTEGFASFKYRGIDDVYNTLHPLLAKHKVFIMPEVLGTSREERTNFKGTMIAYVTSTVKFHFVSGEDGSEVVCVVAGEGMDSGDKATPKSLSIAMKYAIFQAFAIPTEDMVDPDAETDRMAPKTANKAPSKPVEARKPASNAPDPVWLTKMAEVKKALEDAGFHDSQSRVDEQSRILNKPISKPSDLTVDDLDIVLKSVKPDDIPF